MMTRHGRFNHVLNTLAQVLKTKQNKFSLPQDHEDDARVTSWKEWSGKGLLLACSEFKLGLERKMGSV